MRSSGEILKPFSHMREPRKAAIIKGSKPHVMSIKAGTDATKQFYGEENKIVRPLLPNEEKGLYIAGK